MKTWELKVKVSIADSWIADGFNMAERLDELGEAIQGMLPYSYGHEVVVKSTITKQPDPKAIEQLQNGELEAKD